MKKIILLLVILFAMASSAFAQDQTGKISLAANLNYGTEIESLGIGLRAQYGFWGNMRGALEYKYYFDRRNVSAWGVTTDIHYLIGAGDSFSLYPIGGLTLSRWTADLGRSNVAGVELNHKYSNNRLGLDLGAGGQFALTHMTFLQLEIKRAFIKDYSQFVISAGFMVQF